jgi:hypothetical protein
MIQMLRSICIVVLLAVMTGCADSIAPFERDNHRDPGSTEYKPRAPEGLTADRDGDAIVLTWTIISPYADANLVERALDDQPFEEIGRLPASASTFSDEPPPAITARYRVSAIKEENGRPIFEPGPEGSVTLHAIPQTLHLSFPTERTMRASWSMPQLGFPFTYELQVAVNDDKRATVAALEQSTVEIETELAMRSDEAIRVDLWVRIGEQRAKVMTNHTTFVMETPYISRITGDDAPTVHWWIHRRSTAVDTYILERCTVEVWTCHGFDEVGRVDGNTVSLVDYGASPEGKYLYRIRTLTSASSNPVGAQRMRAWVERERASEWGYSGLTALPDGEHYLIAQGGRLSKRNIRTGQVAADVAARDVHAIAIHPAGDRIIQVENERVRVRSLPDLTAIQTQTPYVGPRNVAAISPDGRLYAIGFSYTTFGTTPTEIRRVSDHSLALTIPQAATGLAFTEDNRGIILANNQRTAIYDVSSGELIRLLYGGFSRGLAQHPLRPLVAIATDREVQLRDLVSFEIEARIPIEHSYVRPGMLNFSRNGKYLVATSHRGSVWDIDQSRWLGSLELTDAHSWSMITDDGEWLATIDGRHLVRFRRSDSPSWTTLPPSNIVNEANLQ